MKILKINKKEAEIHCIPETLDDLWHLEKIIGKKDIVYGSTDRKIKPKKEGEKSERIKLFIELQAEEAHFQEYSKKLRINGIILSGKPEEHIELKSHQSIELGVGEKIRIKKEKLTDWQIERLKKAEKESAITRLLVVLLDEEQAELAFINNYTISKKALVKEKNKGKRYAQEKNTKNDYFEEILEKIKTLEPKKILLAGPGFAKENLKKFIENKKTKGMPQIMAETTNSIGETGFNEILREGKLQKIEKELQLTKETKTIEFFLEKLAKEKAEYGLEKVKEAIEQGKAEKLIISETHLMQNREKTEQLLDLAEKYGTETEIISSRNPQEKIIQNMTGIVCTLRYKKE
jgi:protein pelota